MVIVNWFTDGNEDEALINYWHGKALDVEDNFSKKAQEHLQQAVNLLPSPSPSPSPSVPHALQVKLNASLTDAWNCLGNSYWKDADLKNARSCIMTALSQVSSIIINYWSCQKCHHQHHNHCESRILRTHVLCDIYL